MIAANKSTLQFDDFFIIKSSLDFIQPKNHQEINLPEIFRQYKIDLNYSFRRDKESFFLFIKVAVNQVDPPSLGYKIFAEAVGALDLNRINSLPELDAKAWRLNAISYGISFLRAHIDAITTFGAFGKYTLPLIDLMHLIASKEQLMKSRQIQPKTKEMKPTDKPKRKKSTS